MTHFLEGVVDCVFSSALRFLPLAFLFTLLLPAVFAGLVLPCTPGPPDTIPSVASMTSVQLLRLMHGTLLEQRYNITSVKRIYAYVLASMHAQWQELRGVELGRQ